MSPECERWCDYLFEPDGSLSEQQRDGLAAHLAICPDCRVDRELLLESWTALDDLDPEPSIEPCPLLRAKVWEKIREEGYCKEASDPLSCLLDRTRLWRTPLVRLTAAAAALMLGFGLGRSVRSTPVQAAPHPVGQVGKAVILDQTLLELASQDGYSVAIFPEASGFSPLDREMMSELATSPETKAWLTSETQTVLPLQYISKSAGE